MIFLKATGRSGRKIFKELERNGINMIEYLLKLQVKDENKIKIINNHIFREKHMTDEEMEEKQIEFCKSMRENYREAGKTLEIIEYSMTEVS